MKILSRIFSCVILLFAIFPAKSSEPTYQGPTRIAVASAPLAEESEVEKNLIYVLCKDAHQVKILASQTVPVENSLPEIMLIGTLTLPASPTGICVTKNGALLYITSVNDNADGFLSVFQISSFSDQEKVTPFDTKEYGYEEIYQTELGHWPVSPVLSADENSLYILRQYAGEICTVNPKNGQILTTHLIGREPIAMCLTPDGKKLVIAHHLPIRHELFAIFPGLVTLIDIDPFFANYPTDNDVHPGQTTILLTNGTSCIYDITISPDGKFAYIPHVLGHPTQNTGQIEMGWIINNGIAVVDLSKREFVNTILLDDGGAGMANPRGIALSEDGKTIAFTITGRHEIGFFDVPTAFDLLQIMYPNPISSALVGAKSPVINQMICTKATGLSPRYISRLGQHFIVSSYFSDSIDILSEKGAILSTIKLGPEPGTPNNPYTDERLGEIAFCDATLCYQQWLSCETCHPEARMDGSQWDLLNDGMNNPKSTKSMLFSHRTPPTMALGVRKDAELAVRAGFTHIMFKDAPEKTCVQIDKYLKSLRPIRSPYRNSDGSLTESAQRGETIFQKHCAYCHPAQLYTDLHLHDVGTHSQSDPSSKYDTPTLIEIWRSAPYLHDSSAKTIRESITTQHGHIDSLTDAEINDLILYVLSL